jgi:hypothetical protein
MQLDPVLRKRIQFSLLCPPVEPLAPVVDQFLQIRQVRTMSPRLSVGDSSCHRVLASRRHRSSMSPSGTTSENPCPDTSPSYGAERHQRSAELWPQNIGTPDHWQHDTSRM